MRTKTLLLTAALGLAGVATTMAQVYSVNAVGYVNTTLKAGFNMIGNPLDNKAGNTAGNLFGITLPDGSYIYKFVAGAYDVSNGYSTAFGWDNPDQKFEPGDGAFVWLPPGSANTTVTFVGEVMQGPLSQTLITGFNMVTSKVPQAGALQADLKYAPQDGDTVFQFDSGVGYKPSTGYSELFGWDPADPQVGVGEAIFISKTATPATPWTRTFSVNQ